MEVTEGDASGRVGPVDIGNSWPSGDRSSWLHSWGESPDSSEASAAQGFGGRSVTKTRFEGLYCNVCVCVPIQRHGLTDEQLCIPQNIIQTVGMFVCVVLGVSMWYYFIPTACPGSVSDYTREAGVRNLEKNISALCRAVAVEVSEILTFSSLNAYRQKDVVQPSIHLLVHVDSWRQSHKESSCHADPDVADWHPWGEVSPFWGPVPASMGWSPIFLQPKRYEHEVSERLTVPGVAVGLAWTPVGGDILFVEASKMPGEGRVVLTGQLGKAILVLV